MSTTSARMPRITSVRASRHRRRLARPWGPEAPENTVIVVAVSAEDGSSGTGFTWTPTVGSDALLALVEDDVAPAVVGMPAHPAVVSRALFARLHEGGSGLVQCAAAAIDLALWDRDARTTGLSVTDRIGRMRDEVPVYGSGVNLHYSIDDLIAQVRRWMDAGYEAVKVKVGRPDVGEDVDRLDAVREVLGPDRALMIDANQRWDLWQAQRALRALARFDPAWIEEPIRADDTGAYRRLRSRIDVPVALGENAHTVHRFRDLIDADACDLVQPNVIRVGGITPFLRIAELAESSSIPVAPHLLPDLSAQLALALPRLAWVEDVEDSGLGALGMLRSPSPVSIAAGRASVAPFPGLGLDFLDTGEAS
jgi:L-alanine-DL-glutamate epimerase-like enolase superfamily enzyme